MALDVSEEVRGRVEGIARGYLGLVYRAAVRRMGEGGGAEDVTQAVFLVVMAKAKVGRLPAEGRMAGWLLKVTEFAVRAYRRGEGRRKRRDGEVARERGVVGGDDVGPGIAIPGLGVGGEEAALEEVRRELDRALLKLGAVDREVVVRRYLQGEAVGAVGTAVGMSEGTAGRRILRALEKLRKILRRRGVTAAVGAVVGVMVAEAAKGAPAGLEVGGGSAAAVSVAKGAGVMMKVALVKVATVAGVGFVVIACGSVAVSRSRGVTEKAATTVPASAPVRIGGGWTEEEVDIAMRMREVHLPLMEVKVKGGQTTTMPADLGASLPGSWAFLGGQVNPSDVADADWGKLVILHEKPEAVGAGRTRIVVTFMDGHAEIFSPEEARRFIEASKKCWEKAREKSLETKPAAHAGEDGEFYVMGAVKRPGVYVVRPRTTLREAVNAAGISEAQSSGAVVELARRNDDGTETKAEMEVGRILAGKEADWYLQPNDVLKVTCRGGGK